MTAMRRIVAPGLALALGLASVAGGQTSPADATYEARHLGWATVFDTPGRLDRVEWAGSRPFRPLLFRVTNDYRICTFILPIVCASLSPKPVRAGTGSLDRVQRVSGAINTQPTGELTAPSWTFISNTPGDDAFHAADTRGRRDPVARRTAPVDARPPPPPTLEPRRVAAPTCSVVLSVVPVKGAYEITVDATRSATGTSGVAPSVTMVLRDDTGAGVEQQLTLDSSLNGTLTVSRPGIYRATATVSTPQAVDVDAYRYEGTATCDASVTVEKPARVAAIFFDVLGGKQRRVRPIEDTDRAFAQCSPLVGLKFGVARRFRNDWEVVGALGAAISLVTDEQMVRQSALFAEAEANRYLAGGSFIGTGLSLWDLTRSNMWTPAWLLHFGLPLARSARYAVFFISEGRLFLKHIDDVRNNYEIWGGVQVKFPR